MLGCIQPMSSPMMNRMFGFFSSVAAGAGVGSIFVCATAGAGVTIGAKPRGTTAAKAVITRETLRFILLSCSKGICMGTSCDEVPPVQVKVSARLLSHSIWQTKPELSACFAELFLRRRSDMSAIGTKQTCSMRLPTAGLPISIYEVHGLANEA